MVGQYRDFVTQRSRLFRVPGECIRPGDRAAGAVGGEVLITADHWQRPANVRDHTGPGT